MSPQRVVHSAEVHAQSESLPAGYAKYLKDDYEKWGKVVKTAGIKPQ